MHSIEKCYKYFMEYNAYGYKNKDFKPDRLRVLSKRLKFKNAPDPTTVYWEKLGTEMSLRKKVWSYIAIVLFSAVVIFAEVAFHQF